MRHLDEYRDSGLARALLAEISRLAAALGRLVSIMEVCGSHTTAIGRYGIRGLLPKQLRLVSGPGCPVCVTAARDVDMALALAGRPGIVLATYGDMLRVPGTGGRSLQQLRASGADIRVVSSARECLSLAAADPGHEIVFLGIGFETTSPTTAAVVSAGRQKGLKNLSVFSVHKLIPPALQALLEDPDLAIDGFLCPGHVSTIIGADAYRPIIAAGRAAVITGFEPVDILEGTRQLLRQLIEGRPAVAIQYARAVKPEGNRRAVALMEAVFEPVAAQWRGLGALPLSGLALNDAHADFDALKRFDAPVLSSAEAPGCCCGDILRGVKTPAECPLFQKACTPESPVGPCMVSSEGTCAAYYRYAPG